MMEKQIQKVDFGLVQWIIQKDLIKKGSLYCLDKNLNLHKVDTNIILLTVLLFR